MNSSPAGSLSASQLPIDAAAIRANFPAFQEGGLKGWHFFENAGGSYTARQVLDRLDQFYRSHKVQPYAPYPAALEAGAEMDQGYARLAQALGLDTQWLHLGPSTSANTYVLAQAFAGILQPGDAIIVTDQDHEANSGVWRRLEEDGIEIRQWKVGPQTGHLDPAALDELLDGKVRLVAFPHVSNIVGEINPVAEICAKVRAAGAVSVVDGVSYAPHGLPDVAALGADIYLFSAYKTYGPHQGVMTINPELAERLPNQGHYFNAAKTRLKFNPAGPDHAQIAAAAGIADYLEDLAKLAPSELSAGDPFATARHAMRAQEEALMAPLLDYLGQQNRLRLIGPAEITRRVPTFSLALEGDAFGAARELARHNIMAGGGHFYAVRLLESLGLDLARGVLRLSFVHYTDHADIAALIAALDRL